jgi:L-alanine-DL-glutamate epimerase-like enolase superfamily enzyme
LRITAAIEQWRFKQPFRITGHTFERADLLVVSAELDGATGMGEAAGVYYHGETAASMLRQITAIAELASKLTGQELLALMPPGGARNALDCALWDLQARQSGQPVWVAAGTQGLHPLTTTFTLGADTPSVMVASALAIPHARALKLKLLGDGLDVERVAAVRSVRPDVWMGVDANQGFTRHSYEALLPTLVSADVQLVEQPFPKDRDQDLDGLRSPIAIAADESVQVAADLERVSGRVQVVNIKLDKCGGLTEGLEMVTEARRLGLRPMVGNMVGTSLSMAPAYVLGQLCDFVDLDGPVFLESDRIPGLAYRDGRITCPEAVWGLCRDEVRVP